MVLAVVHRSLRRPPRQHDARECMYIESRGIDVFFLSPVSRMEAVLSSRVSDSLFSRPEPHGPR